MNFTKIFATLLFCLTFVFGISKVEAAELGTFEEETQAVKLLNKVRAEVGLKGVAWHSNSNLQKAAELRAQELEELFEHTRPDGSDCFSVLNQFGVRYMTCAENIACGTSLDAEGAIDLWYNSPGHYANMTNRKVKEVGLAAWHDNSGNVYWVQLFIG